MILMVFKKRPRPKAQPVGSPSKREAENLISKLLWKSGSPDQDEIVDQGSKMDMPWNLYDARDMPTFGKMGRHTGYR